MINQILEQNKDLSIKDKLSISLKDISKGIKQQLNKEYPKCKFSIQTQYYSGGQSLHISIMETDFKIILPFEEISEEALFSYLNRSGYSAENIKEMQSKKYHQLSHFVDDKYNKDVWNNGVFLTQEGYNLAKRIIELTNKFNWDNSDSSIDYFDVKFYLHLNIGKWDKDYNEIPNKNPIKTNNLILSSDNAENQQIRKYKIIDNEGNQYIYNAKNENDAKNSFFIEKKDKIKTILYFEVLK